ncbi:hypothetical protein [Halovenus salina]|uniref:Uncharacterized protein n=1 Tax=Halovenus salina TaxID=1510225 RepID=A0ABD5W6K3_9EURY
MSENDSERSVSIGRWIDSFRRYLSVVVPGFIRRNLTIKLLTILLLGALVSGGAVVVLYDSIDDGLTEQVDSQVQSDATLHASLYNKWLNDQWGC